MNKVSFSSNATKFGLFISFFMILLSLVYYILDLEIFNFPFIISNLVITLTVVVGLFIFGIKSYRENSLGGKITFWQAAGQGLFIGFVAYAIMAVFNYVFYAFIAPDYMLNQVDAFVEFMEGMGLPDEAVDEAVKDFEEKSTPMGQLINGLKSGAIMTVVISAIVGLSIKKDTTETQIV